MVKTDLQANDVPTTAETSNKPAAQPEATLKDVLDTLHDSDFFPRTGKDAPSRFWSAYERVARQHDEELIERHNGEMDVLLIFAGLFSAVSSAFIVNMQSSLSPSASDTTNAILKILVNKIDNNTFPAQEATLPVWTGPSSTTIWIQTLAYTSLSSSLLAAFGAMSAKQWLGHFKTSRFGRGTLHERCQQRQKKFDGLEAWHFSTILSTLPIFLQLSLFFFGVALAANIWTMQHTVASVIMATTGFGVIFTFFTLVSSLRSPDCPFQTPVSTMSHRILQGMTLFGAMVRETWVKRPKSWADLRDLLHECWMGLLGLLRGFSGRALHTAKDLISLWIATPFVTQLSQMFPSVRQFRSTPADPETAADPEQVASAGSVPLLPVPAGEETAFLDLHLDLDLDLPVEMAQVYAVQSSAVQWILEASTDTDNIAAAAGMLPEIEWPAEDNVVAVFNRLKSHFHACFDSTQQILPLAQARATACLKAMCHFSVEQDMKNSFYFNSDGYISATGDFLSYYMIPDQGFLIISCAVATCTVNANLDMASVPLNDRMWMARMFIYRLHNGDKDPDFVDSVIGFIGTCLDSKAPTCLVADCVLLAGMLIGGKVNRRDLARLDKSKLVNRLQELVLSHTLGMLVDDTAGGHETALKLIHPLLQDYDKHIPIFFNDCLLNRALNFLFHLLEEGTPGEDHIQSNSVARLIRILDHNRPFLKSDGQWTSAQFDMLVDYHFHLCEGTDHHAITRSFMVLISLCGSPSTHNRMRRYIDTMIHFMGHETTRFAALHAACVFRSTVASMGQDNESFRECFSKALASVILSSVRTPLEYNPFTEITFFDSNRDMAYLILLRTLAQEITWQPQLHQTGHFDNCLAIAKTLTTEDERYLDQYAVPVAHIIAIIDDLDEGCPLSHLLQACPSWPLLLRAWLYIFHLDLFFDDIFEMVTIFQGMNINAPDNVLSTADCLAALPNLVLFARKHSCDDQEEALLALVEQVCSELDKETQQHEQGETEGTRYIVLRYPALSKQIRQLLETAWNDHLSHFS